MIKGLLAALIVLTSGFLVQGSNHDCPAYPASKWSFNPETLAEKAEFQNQMMVQLAASVPGRDVFGATVRQNFVDEHIFSRLESEGIQPANLAGDEEFIRRIYLDLTGRLPDYDKVISFLDDQSTNKRDRLIDELLNSEAFIDRWTFWLNEVIRNTSSYANVTIQGRNALHFYIRDAIERNVPYNVLVSDLIKGSGSARSNGPATFVLRSYSAADPLHDSWDDFTANTMSAFLGITSLCVSCHDGARHLEAINTYLAERKRREFWQQAAFVSQMTITRIPLDGSNRIVDYEIEDRPGGAYHTRVTGGQRPLRSGGPYSPVYMLSGDAPRTSGYRAELARILTSDIQFARATANRVWAHLMGVGIVDP
ncbi:MAG: DUF1549 domain-containing protein, partial [Acidobacteria bacterium]|nr:DUF1549 domain-containing protein [Acidobacteriota bacterium]